MEHVESNARTANVEKYYGARAGEYDATVKYWNPRAAAGVEDIKSRYRAALKGQDVLEIACGTGFWTEVAVSTAHSVVATDRDPTLVSIVRHKLSSAANLRCQVADAYALETVTGPFTAAFAQFWWSHIPKSKIRSFLAVLHTKLSRGALVLFSDDWPYKHEGTRRFDAAGNLLEDRLLRNGDRFEIIKNFPTEFELRTVLKGFADELTYVQCPAYGYWMLSYRTV